MRSSWAIGDVDLYLEPGPVRGRRVGLERALRAAVVDGRLAPGTRLPSSRTLAVDLAMARNTVAEAYAQLVAEGYLTAHRGAGTVVAERPADPVPVPVYARASTPRFDLRPGRPDLSAFPRARWAAAQRRALAAAGSDAFWPAADPRGRIELRERLAEYLGRARGVRTRADRIVVCAGYTQALAVLGHALAARGARRIALEDPGLPFLREIVARTGLGVDSLAVDEHGARIGGDADAIVLTPANQSPLGLTLHPDRRAAALRWAAETGGVVIEDDYDGEFRYDRHPVGALQGLGADHVVYAGSASKMLSPGLRLGWLALPPHLLDDVLAVLKRPELAVGTLEQLTLAEFMAAGDLDRHVRRSRRVYRDRRDRLVAALAREVPRLRVRGVAAGLQILLELPPDGPDEEEAVAYLARRGVAVHRLGWYRHDRSDDRAPGLVVGYAAPSGHAFAGTLDALVTGLAELYGGTSPSGGWGRAYLGGAAPEAGPPAAPTRQGDQTRP
ncbi:PLP-dependent aminotransferase family protein [Embleya sp. NBC_00896]|uniref:MocR-like pyridoxine biosynthesis transcription factor PdxR n=1 Tax=Embleya sp. NBC_00896 TaxID=2975961 RepID=UPI0038683B28|nr:PLP-dependent aminotransferase family protein [Embleya sp. NBC_00896]